MCPEPLSTEPVLPNLSFIHPFIHSFGNSIVPITWQTDERGISLPLEAHGNPVECDRSSGRIRTLGLLEEAFADCGCISAPHLTLLQAIQAPMSTCSCVVLGLLLFPMKAKTKLMATEPRGRGLISPSILLN